MATRPPVIPSSLTPMDNDVKKQQKWLNYLAQRTGIYEMRVPRYAAVADTLQTMGLTDNAILRDVGAGQTEFDFYMRANRQWRGWMENIDGCFGYELNSLWPKAYADFTVCIETVEHIDKPGEFIARMEACTTQGMVFTTPNPETVDVKALDETHVSEVRVSDWQEMYYQTKVLSCFGKDADTILAWKVF